MVFTTALISLAFSGGAIFAQDGIALPLPDSNYVKLLSSQPALRVYTTYKSQGFRFINPNNGSEVVYRPNSTMGLGIGLTYRWFGLDLGIGLPASKDKEATFGSTQRLELVTSLYALRTIIDIQLQLYKGYYNSNYDQWSPVGDNLVRGDARTLSIGFKYAYLFNGKNMSLRTAFTGDAIQRVSQGSPVLGGQFSLFDLRADSSFLPVEARAEYNSRASIVDANFLMGGLYGGYAATLKLPKYFFFTFYATPGLGLALGESRANGTRNQLPSPMKTRFYYNMQLRSAFGMSNPRFYVIGYVTYERTWLHFTEGTNLEFGPLKTKLMIGYRLQKRKRG